MIMDSAREKMLEILLEYGGENQVRFVEDMRIDYLLIIYHNWRNRNVYPRQRRVHISSKLLSNKFLNQYFSSFLSILNDCEIGSDLSGYFPKKYRKIYDRNSEIKTGRHQRDHLDLLLNDYGIHHFHFLKDGKVLHVKELLFLIVTFNDMFFLDIAGHEFSGIELARVAIQSWPEIPLFNRIEGIHPPKSALNPSEVHQLRDAGMSHFIKINESLYAPNPSIGGLTGAGTSFPATRWANLVLRVIREFEGNVHSRPDLLRRAFAEVGEAVPVTIRMHFHILEPFGVGIGFDGTSTVFKLLDEDGQVARAIRPHPSHTPPPHV